MPDPSPAIPPVGGRGSGGCTPLLPRINSLRHRAERYNALTDIVNGNMVAGFALVAWPAQWNESGVMTFIVNQQGKVFQNNLGPQTATIASRMKVYDPDATWSLVQE